MASRLRGEAQVLRTPEDAPPGDVIALAQGDYGRLLAVLYEEGHFAAEISITLAGREAANLTPLDRGAAARPVRVMVRAGPVFRLGRARVAPLPQGAQLPEGFRPGAPAGTEVIVEAGRAGVDAWRSASHAKARITREDITARHAASELNVDLRIDPGPALRFGALEVPTSSGVRASRLRAIAGLPSGAPFDPEAVEIAR
ncbi:MAG: outer membrane protein assembly factor, partial [Pseudomonadota bacterium]